jgi:MFS family permease
MQTPHSPWLKPTLLLLASLTVLSGATIAASLPGIAAHFSHEPGAGMLSRLILTAPALTIALIAPFAGYFIHRYGRLKPILFGLVLYALAGTSGLYAQTLYELISGRVGLGVAVAIVMTAGTVLAGDYFEHEERQRFLGFQGGFVALGGMVFITGGGILSDLHWRAPFGVYALSLALIPLVLWVLHEPGQTESPASDVALDESGIRELWPIFAVAFLTMVIFYIIPTQLPFVAIDHLGASGTEAGFLIGTVTLFAAIGAFNYRRLRKRLSIMQLFVAIYLLQGIGLGVVGLADALYQAFLPLIFAGLGAGLGMANAQAWFLERAPAHKRAKLAGFMTASLFLGQFASPLLVHPLLALFALHEVFSLFGLGLIIAATVLLIVQRRSHRVV